MSSEDLRVRVNGVIKLLDGLTVKEANQVLDAVRRQTQEAVIKPQEDGLALGVPAKEGSFMDSLEALIKNHSKGNSASV